MREKEGAALAEDLVSRAEVLGKRLMEIRVRAPRVVEIIVGVWRRA